MGEAFSKIDGYLIPLLCFIAYLVVLKVNPNYEPQKVFGLGKKGQTNFAYIAITVMLILIIWTLLK